MTSKELFERYQTIHKRRVKAWEKWEQAKEDIESLPSSANYSITGIRTTHEDYQSMTERKAIALTEARNDVLDAIYDDVEMSSKIFDLIMLLDNPHHVDVLYNYYLGHKTAKETAEIVGKSEKSIYRFLHEARNEFDKILADVDGAKERKRIKKAEFDRLCENAKRYKNEHPRKEEVCR